jgi:quercetin dioxygenase-like cupin family protein
MTNFIQALTDVHVEKLIEILDGSLHAMSAAVRTLWLALGPIAIGYLTWRQAVNKKSALAVAQKTQDAVEENTALTKKSGDKLDLIARTRGMVTNGKKPSEGVLLSFDIDLPGPAYERFTLSEGAPVLWKSEPCEDGRLCRFAVAGESHMGFHAHNVPEKLTVITGVLEIVTLNGKFHIGPGEEFTSPPEEIHSVGFCGYGEVLAHWTGQMTNHLAITIYQ